jgi:hypothetical protein
VERKVLLETYDDEPNTTTSRIPIPIKNLKLGVEVEVEVEVVNEEDVSSDDKGEEWQTTLFKVTKDERNGLTKCLLRSSISAKRISSGSTPISSLISKMDRRLSLELG